VAAPFRDVCFFKFPRLVIEPRIYWFIWSLSVSGSQLPFEVWMFGQMWWHHGEMCFLSFPGWESNPESFVHVVSLYHFTIYHSKFFRLGKCGSTMGRYLLLPQGKDRGSPKESGGIRNGTTGHLFLVQNLGTML
jgi:hypothetical protein